MIRISAISTLTLCLFALVLEAQTPTDSSNLAKYPTRLTTTFKTVSQGYLYSAGDTTVQLLKSLEARPQTGGMDMETVPVNLLYSLEFKVAQVGKSRKHRRGISVAIGAAIGAGVGLVLASVVANDIRDASPSLVYSVKGLVFLAPTALGAGIGYWGSAPLKVKFDIGGKQSEYVRQKKDIQKYSMMR